MVGPNNKEQTVPVTLGLQGSTDDQILTGLTLGGKVLTSTAVASTGSGTGGFPFRGGGGGLGGGGAVQIGGGPAGGR
jgi:macrolide-specific efflux system membrane fusion protein